MPLSFHNFESKIRIRKGGEGGCIGFISSGATNTILIAMGEFLFLMGAMGAKCNLHIKLL